MRGELVSPTVAAPRSLRGVDPLGAAPWRQPLLVVVRHPLVALTLLGAVLRLPTLGLQHLWIDEALTAGLLRLDLPHMLTALPPVESTPPLYYLLAWPWAHVVGSGAFALRLLSAAAGIATVPVAHVAAARFAGRRAALLTAGLAAVSPMLVWYSQEARPYALLVLLCALSVVAFGRALEDRSRRSLALWAAVSTLALATHYFAAFLVAAEAAWLLLATRPRRAVLAACLPIGACACALLPLIAQQRSQSDYGFIGGVPLATRTVSAAGKFVAGETGVALRPAAVAALVLAGVGLALLALRAAPAARRRVLPIAALAAGALGLPLVLALAGFDYVLARYLSPAWLPVAILVVAGLGGRRAGRLGLVVAVALGLISLSLCLAVPVTAQLRREAIDARLVGVFGLRATVPFAFVPVARGASTSGSVACPGGYTARSGGASWLGSARGMTRLRTAVAGPERAGWSARPAVPAPRAGIVQLYAVCAPRFAGARVGPLAPVVVHAAR